jgi:hypothetical protein
VCSISSKEHKKGKKEKKNRVSSSLARNSGIRAIFFALWIDINHGFILGYSWRRWIEIKKHIIGGRIPKNSRGEFK